MLQHDVRETEVLISKLNDNLRLAANKFCNVLILLLTSTTQNRLGLIKTCNKVNPKALLFFELVVGKCNISYLTQKTCKHDLNRFLRKFMIEKR